jgi:ATP-dependent protease HslVU (ClpYQ) peptidase subunit
MTVCVCYDGVLYADRSGVGIGQMLTHVDMGKLYVAANKRIAMAVSGQPYQNDSFFKKHMKLLAKELKPLDSLHGEGSISDELMAFFSHNSQREIILMTHVACYMLDTVGLIKIDPKEPAFIGSGGKYAYVAMEAGKTVPEAIELAQIIDSAGMVSAVDSVSQADLLPW